MFREPFARRISVSVSKVPLVSISLANLAELHSGLIAS